MSAAYFEDHPTDPTKVILRKKPHLDKGRDYEEGFIDGMQHQMQLSVSQAIEQAHKQEPVGQLCEETYGRGQVMWFNKPDDGSYVYTFPPQRQWVGLTQEEFDKLIDDAGFTRSDLLMIGACVEQIVDLVEKKLKEKNT